MARTALATSEAVAADKPPSYSGHGRPSDLSYDVINRIGARVLQGNYPLPAARAEGVPERTFLRWMKQGEADTAAEIPTIHAHLWQVIDQKEAEAECELIKEAATRKVGWQGPMTVVSRRQRERWEDKQALNGGVTVQIGIRDGDVVVNTGCLPSQELSPPALPSAGEGQQNR